MAPIRSFALLVMVSSAAALNIHARQAESSAVVDPALAAASQAVAPAAPTSAAAAVVVVAPTPTPVIVPVVVPVVSSVVVPVVVPVATSAAVVVVPVVSTSAAVIVPSVVPVSSSAVVAATTAAPVAVTSTSARAIATVTPVSNNPTSSSSAVVSVAGAQSTGGASTLTANNVAALDETYGGVSKPVIIVLCAAVAAIVCAALGIFLFRKYGRSPSEKFKHRLSDAGGPTAAFLHHRSLDNMEHGAASAAMIERPAFGRSLHSSATATSTTTTPRSFTSTVARPVPNHASNNDGPGFSSPAPVRSTPKSLPRIPTTHETLHDVIAAESSGPTHPGAAYFSQPEYETVVGQPRGYEYGTYH
ncbi:hypothetical protein HDU87_004437 [Geranomyces variabilis]|uniref:Uncharacterized protein n=1 Tax=Geranomyces variabilis TaxID=109894 RepID=A0AAD5XRW7_9FUNG|nr:hypothetical protein HDU87_004437 [Geranomyces variabilis]